MRCRELPIARPFLAVAQAPGAEDGAREQADWAFCFYPMSERRGDVSNWFTLPYDDLVAPLGEVLAAVGLE